METIPNYHGHCQRLTQKVEQEPERIQTNLDGMSVALPIDANAVHIPNICIVVFRSFQKLFYLFYWNNFDFTSIAAAIAVMQLTPTAVMTSWQVDISYLFLVGCTCVRVYRAEWEYFDETR